MINFDFLPKTNSDASCFALFPKSWRRAFRAVNPIKTTFVLRTVLQNGYGVAVCDADDFAVDELGMGGEERKNQDTGGIYKKTVSFPSTGIPENQGHMNQLFLLGCLSILLFSFCFCF